MKKLLKTLACSAVAALVGASAFANYDWYDTSIGIGGIKSNFQDWSRGNGDPDTDLGALTSLTLSSVEMNIWDDDNDRGGVNMFFRLYGADGQIGGDVDVWLGGAERIEGSVHDFSVSYTGPFDLADAFGVTLEDGKTYYLNMWAKSYGPAGDHWYSGDGDNYHTKFVYCGTPKTYTLVESADDLVVGADYLVVSTVDGAYSAMKNEVNGSGIGCLGLADDAISGNTISAASDAIVWQLLEGTAVGQCELYNAAANVFAADSDDLAGRAQLLADGTDALAQWTIDTSALPAVKFYSVSYPDRCLQRDNFAANERFAAYDRTHVAPRLYRDDSTVQTVTFNWNGAPLDPIGPYEYLIGGTYDGEAFVGDAPVWAGHVWRGWYTEAEGGSRIKKDMEVEDIDELELWGHWANAQTVLLDANGGEGAPASILGIVGELYWCLPTPTKDGYTFMGWYADGDGDDGSRVKNGISVVPDMAERTLTAHWAGRQTVTLNANGGTCTPTSKTCYIGEYYWGLPTPVKDGFTFMGWYADGDGDDGSRVKNGISLVPDMAERTLTAHWAGRQTVTLNANGGTCTPTSKTCYIGEYYWGLPTPTRDGYRFIGWYADDDDGSRVKAGVARVTDAAERKLYAHWKESASSSSMFITGFSFSPRAKAGARAVTTTDTITAAILAATSTTYTGFSGVDKTKDGVNSDAVYAGQSAKGSGNSIQLRIKNSDCGIVTTTSGGTAKEVTVTSWNGTARGLQVYGKTSAYTDATDLYDENEAGTLLTTINDTTTFQVPGSYSYIGLRSASGTVYPIEIVIGWEASSSDQSVTLSPAGPIEAEVGDEVIITATADGFSGDVTWSWTGSGTPDGNRFTVDTTSAFEAATITATATYGTETASQSVTVTVTAPKHAITIDSTIQNGTVTTDPEDEAAEGATVTVTANPASGYKLGSILVNDVALAAGVNTFMMPAEDVTVSATFVELSGDVLTRATTGVSSGAGYSSWTATGASGTTYAGTSAGGNDSIQLNASSSTSKRGIVITGSTGRDVASVTVEWNSSSSSSRSIAIYGSATAYTGPADLSDADTRGTSLGSLTPGQTALAVPAGYPYIGIYAPDGVIYLDSVTIKFAPAAFSITLDPATDFEVAYNASATITATPHNAAEGNVSYGWTIDDEPVAGVTGNVLTLDTSVPDVYTVVCTAVDAAGAVATNGVSYLVNEPASPSVSLVASAESVRIGDAVTITATASDFSGEVEEWVWVGDGSAVDSGNTSVFTVDTSIAGDHLVQVEAIYGTESAEAEITIAVEGPHDIELDVGDNGSATAPATAYAGDTVTVTVDPDDGYALDAITVNLGEVAVTGTSFVMPDEDVLVEVTFVEVSDLYFQFEASDVGTSYSGTSAVFTNTGATAETTPGVAFSLSRTCRGNVSNDKKVGTASIRLAPLSGSDAVVANAAAFESPIAKVSFQYGIYGSDSVSSFKVQVSADGETWSDLADLTASATTSLQTYTSASVADGMKFIRFVATNSGSSNDHRFNVDEIQIWFADVPMQTVTFNWNGAPLAPIGPFEYPIGGTYDGEGFVGDAPVWAGHVWRGWYTAAEGGSRIKKDMEVEDIDELELWGHWANAQTVILDANGGQGAPASILGIVGELYWCLPTPTKDGYTFMGWYADGDGDDGSRVKNGISVVPDMAERTLTAHWAGRQTVTLNANGGTCTPTSKTCYIGEYYWGLPTPVKDGFTFMGWYADDDDGSRVKNGISLVPDMAERTLTAHWSGRQTVYFEANGGTCTPTSKTCYIGEYYWGLPTPTRDGYRFIGWYADDDDGSRVKAGVARVTDAAERKLYAHWKEGASTLAITAFDMTPRAAGPVARSAAPATVECTLWFGTVAGTVYEVLWTPALNSEWTVLKRWTADEDGELPVTVDVPAGPTGFFRLVEIAD